MAIGIGARSDVSAGDIIRAIAAAETQASCRCEAYATYSDAKFIDGVREAARHAAVGFIALPLAALQARSADCVTRSERSMARLGVFSIAEAAALAAAGTESRLITPRIVCGNVTVAAALSADHGDRKP